MISAFQFLEQMGAGHRELHKLFPETSALLTVLSAQQAT